MTISEPVIKIVRVPSLIAIAASVAPLVRLGHITDAEGRAMVKRRYQQAAASLIDKYEGVGK